MELVDRYLNAVKFWLPGKQKDDIITELSDDLRSQIDEQESSLGRKLVDSEVEPILKRFGSPMAVAQRYLPKQCLIGPALFPIYRMIIRALILYFLLPWLVLWMAIVIFSPDFRADHAGALFSTLEPWWLACTYSLFFNTLAFALVDRSHLRSHMVNDWNPRALPPIHDPYRISRGSIVFELIVVVATLALWLQLDAFRRVFHIFGVTITLSPSWSYFFWAFMLLSVAGIGISCLNLSTPRWTRVSASLRLGIDCYTWVLVYLLCRTSLLQSLSGPDLAASDASVAVRRVNSWLANSAPWVIAIGTIVLFFDVRRIHRIGAKA